MKVLLRNPSRELEFTGIASVTGLMHRLNLNLEAVLVIVNGELVPRDAQLADTDVVEVRPVISGGAGEGVS